ncbi:class A beta-lactamase [Actinomadura sp. WMMB 499]|uniref:class A beta-lactamase n=1 Tax=Actinomadura sp. WMMB 499 TaxID=1219491 RepID=UPI001243D3F4|nr:class A beta-lactamase [Actinomadura sp. WMMB 499]QFG24702.1 class A beta-lactamase [Actinomadura sp. WMMB 499]
MRISTFRIRTATGAAALAALAVLAGGAGCGGAEGPAQRVATARTGAAATVAQPQAAPSQAAVSRELARLEAKRNLHIGAYAIDTGTGRFVSHRADRRFPFTSTFKVMACGAVLKKARTSDPGLMERVIRYTEDDLVDYSPETEKHVGTGMTVSALCDAAITLSDNTAGNLVMEQIGGPAGLTRFFRSLGDGASRSDRWETALNEWKPGEKRDTTVPRTWAANLRALTVGDALAPADRDRLIAWMKANTTGDKRIRDGLPDSWTIGDKTGTGGVYGNANDIAIAWPDGDGAPLVMVVLTTGKRKDAGADDAAVAETAAILARGLGKKA